ncbi:MAG: carboxymuconolactone decarboxylase family protein [Thermoanaerobaculia bacterium]|jgi:uncharacterized peroxidase-related enzyme
MSRISSVNPNEASGEAKQLLDAVQAKLGVTPNFIKVLANSPKSLAAYLNFSSSLSEGILDAKTQERLALATAEQNGCQYCVSAHTAIGKKAGLDNAEIEAARKGTSEDARADAALKFSRALIDSRGEVTTAEVEAARQAGLSDGEIVEVISHTALNILTNYIGKASRVEIDFPKVQLLTKAVAQ